MNVESIILPVLSLGGLGLIFGAGLAYASQKFAVQLDPKVMDIRNALPGANCGACGFPGCDGFAKAVSAGDVPINGCPVGGTECTKKIATIMGIEANEQVKMVARIICNGNTEKCKEKFEYQGIQDCVAASMVAGGSKSCSYGCLGLGTCVRACPFDAIEIVDGRIAKVDPEKCTACGICVKSCPKNVITMVPYEQEVVIMCNNNDTGKEVRQKCSVGCIACRICVKACPVEAITVENNLASIDYDKCTNCYACVAKCPTKAIEGKVKEEEKTEEERQEA